MKRTQVLSTIVSALLIAATPTLSLAQSATPAAPSAEPAIVCAHVETDKAVATECAKVLEVPLGAKAELAELVKAAKSKDEAAVKAMLEKHGLTAEQLKDAKVEVKDETNGAEAKAVVIAMTSDPLTITITVKA